MSNAKNPYAERPRFRQKLWRFYASGKGPITTAPEDTASLHKLVEKVASLAGKGELKSAVLQYFTLHHLHLLGDGLDAVCVRLERVVGLMSRGVETLERCEALLEELTAAKEDEAPSEEPSDDPSEEGRADDPEGADGDGDGDGDFSGGGD